MWTRVFSGVTFLCALVMAMALYEFTLISMPSKMPQENPLYYGPVLLWQNDLSHNQTSFLNLSDAPIELPTGLSIPPGQMVEGSVKLTCTDLLKSSIEKFKWQQSEYSLPLPAVKPAHDVTAMAEVFNCSICQKQGSQLIIPAKVHQVDETIFIPAGYTLLIKPGAVLKFAQNAGLVTRSPVVAEASAEAPIFFIPLAGSWSAFSIINDQASLSSLKHIRVDSSGELDYLGIKHSGGINIIGGKIKISDLLITNAKGEDAINFKWTSGEVRNLSVFDSASDGVDADFSELLFTGLVVKNSRDDCVDFSAGKIHLQNIELAGCGDKGISNGEGNILSLEKGSITGSQTSVANKDGAHISISNLAFKDSGLHISQYHKKKFFPPPTGEWLGPERHPEPAHLLISSGIWHDGTL
jgi:hypothetical protein